MPKYKTSFVASKRHAGWLAYAKLTLTLHHAYLNQTSSGSSAKTTVNDFREQHQYRVSKTAKQDSADKQTQQRYFSPTNCNPSKTVNLYNTVTGT